MHDENSGLSFALKVALFYGLTLVVELLTAADSQLHFDKAVLEVDFDGDKCEAFLFHLLSEFPYLFLVDKEFAVPVGLVVMQVPEGVGRDVEAHQIKLAVLDTGIGIAEGESVLTQGFYLGSLELDAAFKGLVYEEVEPCFLVKEKQFYTCVVSHVTSPKELL